MKFYQRLIIIVMITFIFVFTNSSYSLDPIQSASIKNTISVSTDKDSYIPEDIIYFSGMVDTMISNHTVRITIKDPSNYTVYQTNLPVDTSGHYKGMTMAGVSTWKDSGAYVVEVLYEFSRATSTFIFKMPHSTTSLSTHLITPPTPNTPQSNSVGTFVLSTNKVNYNIKDLIIISGKVNPLDSTSKNIKITITDSDFFHVYEDFVGTDEFGRFNTTMDSGKFITHPGDFAVTAATGSGTVKLKFTVNDAISEVSNSIPEFRSISYLILVFSILFVIIIIKNNPRLKFSRL